MTSSRTRRAASVLLASTLLAVPALGAAAAAQAAGPPPHGPRAGAPKHDIAVVDRRPATSDSAQCVTAV